MDQKPQQQKPDQQRLRAYLYERRQSNLPPPAPEEIRRALGWGFTPDRSR